jgi:hypothetical protein
VAVCVFVGFEVAGAVWSRVADREDAGAEPWRGGGIAIHAEAYIGEVARKLQTG